MFIYVLAEPHPMREDVIYVTSTYVTPSLIGHRPLSQCYKSVYWGRTLLRRRPCLDSEIFGCTSIKHRSDIFVWDQCLIDAN